MKKLEEYCDCSNIELKEKEAKELIINNWIEFGEEKKFAVWYYFDYNPDIIEDIDLLDIDIDEIKINGCNLLVLAEDEADNAFENYMRNYIDECVLNQIPENLHRYFNEEEFIEDTKSMDGRGVLACYDGYEVGPCNFGDGFGNNIYIYRN